MTTLSAPRATAPTVDVFHAPSNPTTRVDHRCTLHVVPTRDEQTISLIRIRGVVEHSKGPVILVHGAGVRGEIFRPPNRRTLVDALIDDGWDVWLLNWRASIDLDPVPWTLDDAAAWDHPAAVNYITNYTGSPTLKAIIHCQGSTSFAMAAAAGLLPQVTTIISNAVSLHPVIPKFSQFKIHRLRPILQGITAYLNPAWGDEPDSFFARAANVMVKSSHHECDNPVCRQVSFTYGSGRPALWSHANLTEDTHEWIRGEFGKVPMTFFEQMDKSVRAGHLVSVTRREGLPDEYGTTALNTDARWVLYAGAENRCFLPESQQRTFDWLEKREPGRHALHIIPNYGHLDIFLGQHAANDIFPGMLKELNA